MTQLQEICEKINCMAPRNAIDFGPQLIEAYMKDKVNVLTLYNIYDKLEPYVNQKVKSFWKNKLNEPYVKLNNVHLFPCFAGVIVERTLAEVGITGEVDRWVKETEYADFAKFINMAADAGLIELGVLVEPAEMPLAIISAGRRIMLLFFAYSSKSLQELRSYSNLFCNEGELPCMLSEILFDEDGRFDYYDWRNKRWAL